MNYTKSSLSTIESREFQENGLKMTLVPNIPGYPYIRKLSRASPLQDTVPPIGYSSTKRTLFHQVLKETYSI
jgi:hypothetical protein